MTDQEFEYLKNRVDRMEDFLKMRKRKDPNYTPLFDVLCDIVKSNTGVTKDDLMSGNRHRDIVDVRHMAMVVMKECTPQEVINIGRMFNKHHSIVFHAMKKHRNLIFTKDFEYTKTYTLILNEFKKFIKENNEESFLPQCEKN